MMFIQANIKNFKQGRTSNIKYIVIHYTANNGDTALNNLNYFANNVVKSSAHYFVDETQILQSVKDSDTAWHCGSNSYKHYECRNSNSIGVELCSRKDATGKYYFKDETVKNAVKIVKELMKKYNIPLENVLRHYDVTGKICPAPFVNDDKQWENFKSMLVDNDKKELCSLPEFNIARDELVKLGITDGTRPVENVTREQVWAMLYRLYKKIK